MKLNRLLVVFEAGAKLLAMAAILVAGSSAQVPSTFPATNSTPISGASPGTIRMIPGQPGRGILPRADKQTTASVVGVLRSPQGLGLGGSHIRLSPSAAGSGKGATVKALEATSRGDGWFAIRDVPPGTYTLTVTLGGYATITKSGVSLGPGQQATFEASLSPMDPAANDCAGLPRDEGDVQAAAPQTPEPTRNGLARRTKPDETAQTQEPIIGEDDQIFTPAGNRWKDRPPEFRRYPGSGDFQFVQGHWYDPFNNNRLKGDFPIWGNRAFLTLGAVSDSLSEIRRLPFAPLPARAPGGLSMGQVAMSQNFTFSADLMGGDAAYRPADWRVRLTVGANLNYASVGKAGILNATNSQLTRFATQVAGVQEAFLEKKLLDLSDSYDTLSLRAGIQNFNSDFRGFIFNGSAPGVRLFGNLGSNRYQYNLAAFDMLTTDPNSGLNLLAMRKQQVYIANLYRQDFLTPGYTLELSALYDKDDPSVATNTNGFLVRPVPIGPVVPHAVRALYFGLAGDGRVGRVNISHAFYEALGHDTYNAIAGRPVKINAQMGAAELSFDRNWIRYRTGILYASGDCNPQDRTARGFDAIMSNTNFAGGIFSFWNREILNFSGRGVGLTNGGGLFPDLRSGRTSGQANFVNPGVMMANFGADFDLTPKLRATFNLNLIRFADTQPIECLLMMSGIHHWAGVDTGVGIRYRPGLNDNVVFVAGVNSLVPGSGLRQMYPGGPFYAVFTGIQFRY